MVTTEYPVTNVEKEKKKVGGKRYKARRCGRSSPDTLTFLSLRNAQTVEPTNVWAAVSFPSANNVWVAVSFSSANTRYPFHI